jgi:hypothetical protein
MRFFVFIIFQVLTTDIPKKLNRLTFGSCYGIYGAENNIFDKISD